jgi:hypothetical protein
MILRCRFGEHLDSLMFLPSIVDEDEDEDDDGLSMKSVEGLGKRQISWIQNIFLCVAGEYRLMSQPRGRDSTDDSTTQ